MGSPRLEYVRLKANAESCSVSWKRAMVNDLALKTHCTLGYLDMLLIASIVFE